MQQLLIDQNLLRTNHKQCDIIIISMIRLCHQGRYVRDPTKMQEKLHHGLFPIAQVCANSTICVGRKICTQSKNHNIYIYIYIYIYQKVDRITQIGLTIQEQQPS
jgi:hypothetical protein